MNHHESVEILLVEDNPQDMELTLRALHRHHFANVIHTVEDGAEALDFLFARGRHHSRQGAPPPKLILLDLKMPKLNGLEVLRVIKKDLRTATLPVVMLTSSREDPDIRAAYELGVNAYVVKPVEFGEFQEAVRQLGFFWLLINQTAK